MTVKKSKTGESGFSVIEVVIAFTILLIGLLGVFYTFTFTVSYNMGNNLRMVSLAVLQQEAETIRSAKFAPGVTDQAITGGVKPTKVVVMANGHKFRVQITVDDDPFTAGIQTDPTKSLKEITINVSNDSLTSGWQTAIPARIVLWRARSN